MPVHTLSTLIFHLAAIACFFLSTTSHAADPGWRAYQRGDFIEAAKHYETAARGGNRLAQYNYAMMLLKGEGIPLDANAAVVWLRKAADQGLPQAQYNLGLLHEHGQVLPRSQVDATAWFKQAAEQGHVD